MGYVLLLVVVAVGVGLLIRNAMRNTYRQGLLDHERTTELLAEMRRDEEEAS